MWASSINVVVLVRRYEAEVTVSLKPPRLRIDDLVFDYSQNCNVDGSDVLFNVAGSLL